MNCSRKEWAKEPALGDITPYRVDDPRYRVAEDMKYDGEWELRLLGHGGEGA